MSREFNANIGPLVLNLEWRLTLATVLLVPVMLSLGFWQLDRAEEKRALAARHAQQTALPALSLGQLQSALRSEIDLTDQPIIGSHLADRAVVFTARFHAHDYVLLDNRMRDGRFGYELIALADTGETRVPLNLGWIPGDPARLSVPEPTLPEVETEISGRVYLPAGEAYLLADQAAPVQLPVVVQDFPADRFAAPLSGMLDAPVLPVLVRIDAKHPFAKRADWPVINQTPEKHTGYAVQWFTMSAVLLIVFLWRSSNIAALLTGRRPPASP